jgi:hypothetical protein
MTLLPKADVVFCVGYEAYAVHTRDVRLFLPDGGRKNGFAGGAGRPDAPIP